jgi:cell division protease FtsH
LGGEIPKGVLLVGPPGTGKTLLARAVAGEAEVPFFNITGSDFMEMFVGVGASRVRTMFEILKIHSRNKPLAQDLELERVARGTPGFSGADLENILNEAALIAARKKKDAIESEDIEEARDKVLLGLERESLALTEEECRTLAYHEGGHAIVAAVLPNADPIHKVTIVPRGRAMGVTQQLPERDRYLYPREYMPDRLAVMMGGRASEELVFNTMTSGAENDLKEATRLARKWFSIGA